MLITVGLLAVGGAAGAMPICAGGFRHDCVVDGDTLWLGRTKIRLENVDAPEVSRPACTREAELGAAATRRLAALIVGRIEARPSGQDRYGRVLARVLADGRDVGALLIAEGLAGRYEPRRPIDWCSR